MEAVRIRDIQVYVLLKNFIDHNVRTLKVQMLRHMQPFKAIKLIILMKQK